MPAHRLNHLYLTSLLKKTGGQMTLIIAYLPRITISVILSAGAEVQK
jgi:hypothetical protein